MLKELKLQKSSELNKRLKQKLRVRSANKDKDMNNYKDSDNACAGKNKSTKILDKLRQGVMKKKKTIAKEKELVGDLFDSTDSSENSTLTSESSDEDETYSENLDYPKFIHKRN